MEIESKVDSDAKRNKKVTPLQLAIKNNDEDFITLFIEESDYKQIKTLTKFEKTKLAKMIVVCSKDHYKHKGISLLRELVSDIESVNDIIKGLLNIQIDFSKLMHLKGKLDYLEFVKNNETTDIPDKEYKEIDE